MRPDLILYVATLLLLAMTGALAAETSPGNYLGGNTSYLTAAEQAISTSPAESDYLLYNESFAGYSLLYPNGAEVMVTGDPNKSRVTSFLTPSNVTILKVTTVPSNLSLDAVASLTVNKIGQLPNFTLVDVKDTTLGTVPAKRIEYTWTDRTGSLSRTIEVFAPSGGRIYAISVQFPDTLFSSLAPVTEKMISSFQFVPVTISKGWTWNPWFGWYWYPDAADLGRWNWDQYYLGDDYFSSTDYWGTGMDWLDVSNARWDWYMNE